MGAVSSSLHHSVDWIRNQGAINGGTSSQRDAAARRRQQRQRQRRRRQRLAARRAESAAGGGGTHSGLGRRDVEAQDGYGPGGGSTVYSDEDDYDSLDDEDSLDGEEFDDEDDEGLEEEDEDGDDFLEDGSKRGGHGAGDGYDNHPLYFGPAFHPVTEQSPAQAQLQRQIEQQLEHQQRQEYWQQQYRQQQQQQSQQHQYQSQQGPQHSGLSSQLSLNDLILPSAISGMGTAGSGNTSYPSLQPLSPSTENVQDQLYRNSNLYNLISGLNVNPLLTEVQRAGTLDLSVLEQELDDVEGGWIDIEDDEDEEEEGGDGSRNGQRRNREDRDIDYGREGIVREMQPTKRSPTALACNMNLKKSTLRLVKNFTVSADASIPAPSHLRPNYRLDFTFDSLTPCDVKLFWVVKEVEEDGDLGLRLRRLHHLPQPTTYHFPAGMNQRFISPILPLYTMSLPELTMQGLPSTSMRMFQKRQQKQWQQLNQNNNSHGGHHAGAPEDGSLQEEGQEEEDAEVYDQQRRAREQESGETEEGYTTLDGSDGGGGGSQSRRGRFGRKKKGGSEKRSKNGAMGYSEGKKYSQQQQQYPNGRYNGVGAGDEDGYKSIMEDQYYPLVILIEATEEYKPTAPLRSLPTPAVDSPGLYLVDQQAISTFCCFNISSEGGFEIKVMKQKAWINSTNYLIQEIYGFTDSVASNPPTAAAGTGPTLPRPAALKTMNSHRRENGNGGNKALSRSVSRLTRAESIASRVTELTMDRPKKRRIKKKKEKVDLIGGGGGVEDPLGADMGSRKRDSIVLDLGIMEPEPVARRLSVVSSSFGGSRRLSRVSVDSVTNPSAATSVLYGGARRSAEEEDEDQEDDGEEDEDEDDEGDDGSGTGTGTNETAEAAAAAATEAQKESSLILLDAPECVICLSDVKDTIVLPCRHFCICSECGDVLRRRTPQRCPICRQGFQALLHIASVPTRKPEFAMMSVPVSAAAL